MQKCNYMWNKIIDWLVASVISLLGYLSPIKDIAHMLVFFFILDVIYGWLADRKINKAKFQPRKVWNKTVPRMTLSIVLLVAAFILDDVTHQHFVSIYHILGWFIASLLVISIARNGYLVTNWSAIKYIEELFKRKVKSQTDIDIKD